jgi:hypothetical protein
MENKERYNKIQEELKKLISLSKDMKLNSNKVTINLAVQGTSYELKDGSKICVEGDSLEVDKNVYGMDDSGNQTTLNDGSYDLKNGSGITVKGGKISAVNSQAEPSDATSKDSEETDEVTNKKDTKLSDKSAGGASDEEENAKVSEDTDEVGMDGNALETIMEALQLICQKLGIGQDDGSEDEDMEETAAPALPAQMKKQDLKPAVKPSVAKKQPLSEIDAYIQSKKEKANILFEKPTEEMKSLRKILNMRRQGSSEMAPATNNNVNLNRVAPTMKTTSSKFKSLPMNFNKGN